jgi:membrane protease YdiL (CAAX protease family)
VLRTRDYRWWRPLVGLVVFAGGFLVLASVASLPGIIASGELSADPPVEPSDADGPWSLLSLNLVLAALIPAAALASLVAHRLRPGWLGSVVPRLRWRLFLPFGAIALAGTLLGVALSLLVPVDEASATEVGVVTFGQWASIAVVVLLTTPLQAAGEEYAFRGYLLQAIGAWVRAPWVGIAITSFLFALAHGGQNPALFTDRFLFGVLAGWTVWRTGGLEAAIALHGVNNAVAFLISAAYDQVADTLEVTDVPWSFAAVDITAMALIAAAVEWYVRRRPLQRLTPAAP